MRLINANTLKLHSFIDDFHAPKYAILSHTWGAEEVTFEQLRETPRRELESKKGFQKILLAAQQSLRDGLGYVWVDTCCIDKSSSSELSESINSMFRWYNKAAICYAYLEDVGVLDTRPEPWVEGIGLEREYIFEEELAKAKWFTRGWTLQELLAPDKLRFYVKGWTYIGDKQYLEPKLARITGIDIEALDLGSKLGDYSVAKRMSWASRRKTTRPEDTAYCLLGLFDVNMPLLYGEGGHRAFARLQQEVLEDSSDCSIFAWVGMGTGLPSWSEDVARQLQYHVRVGRSIFANSPREFSGSAEILSSHTGEIVLTSIGVKIELPIFSLPHLSTPGSGAALGDQDLYLILIFWRPIRWNEECSTGLVVRRCHKGNLGAPGMFLRHEGYGLIQDTGIRPTEADFRPMYLCKKVPDGNLLRRLRSDLFASVTEEPRAYPKFVGLPRSRDYE